MNPIKNPAAKKETTNSLVWQKCLVIIAKNTPVWLSQLSKEYHQSIQTLDQIPDIELERLGALGITGLWLIGIWERSPASKKIKHLYGNEQRIASAYSILDYSISKDLGGDNALMELKTRALKYGIRLACDIVPNHTAIDSPWLLKNPELYINTEEKPFPAWTFESPNLSADPEVSIILEDGYYTQASTAEAFQYKSKKKDQPLYIFHGNDGTSMPWNDTAQLNYLNPKTREIMKALIIEVARKFKIVRMDAAMTLVKTHFKRLWYPDAGENTIFPRNSNYLSQSEFDDLMPDEFWSEVMHALSKEVPDTFVIAEAFWMMEKYLVDSLGMHAVYNSAFLNRLRLKENKFLREDLIEIIEDNPKILGNFVNYLTTPDEIPAADEYGKGKRYFGSCGLMAILPGIPLFGHGQFEGLVEQYGMDFSQPLREERYDFDLINEHKKLISPLLHQRYRFSDPKNFAIFDFTDHTGRFNANVLVFFNEVSTYKSLIIFNNQDKAISGYIKKTAQIKNTILKDLTQLLVTNNNPIVTLKELRFELEISLSVEELKSKGISINLTPYEFLVFDVA